MGSELSELLLEQILSTLQAIESKLDVLDSIESKLDVLDSVDSKLLEIQVDVKSLDSNVDRIDDAIRAIKMDISGFSYEGKEYPGGIDRVISVLQSIEANVESKG